ncbi:MAG: hypothetical protein BWK80_14310 [Desulfobacteraceae bacterium IS3]|nr:MAG: hypothetical protein BWK80_14310 [Desulfobacteraceae bacterium IS3]
MTYIYSNFAREANNVFYCTEESQFYSYCAEMLLINELAPDRIIEFGSGDGTAIIFAMLRTRFAGIVEGYEINPKAYDLANRHIGRCGLAHRYLIFNDCFFKNTHGFEKKFLTSNPPYLPCFSKKDMILPELYGGPEGTEVIIKLLSLDFTHVMMLIPSISNPLAILQYAKNSGYGISNFLVTELPFGYYSSRPEIQDTLCVLKNKNISFFSDAGYLIAGVLFQKKECVQKDRFEELSGIMQSLK